MIPCVAVVGQVVANRLEAVLVSRPGDRVGDSLPSVRVRAAPHVVTSLRGVARVRDTVFTGGDAVRSFVPAKEGKADPLSQRTYSCTSSHGVLDSAPRQGTLCL